jgi:hypothetical protein
MVLRYCSNISPKSLISSINLAMIGYLASVGLDLNLQFVTRITMSKYVINSS